MQNSDSIVNNEKKSNSSKKFACECCKKLSLILLGSPTKESPMDAHVEGLVYY